MPLLLKVLCPFEISLNVVHEFAEFNDKQESIPVGCVSSAVVTVVGGVPSRAECTCPGGVPTRRCTYLGGVSTWGVPAGGVPARVVPRCIWPGDVPAWVCLPSACWDILPPHPL